MFEDLPVLTEQQNKFLEEYFTNGQNATEAYRSVYGNEYSKTATCSVEGSRLLKNPKITPWIEHFRQTKAKHIEEKINYTVDDAFREFDELKTIALESTDKEGRPNVSAANKAVEMKARLKGLFDDTDGGNNITFKMGEVKVNGVPVNFDVGEDIKNGKQSEDNR